MSHVTLSFTGALQMDVWRHLRSNADDEEAAFLFADVESTSRGTTFHVRGWYRVEPEDFDERGMHGIELTDACRAAIVKRAHDEGQSLIECHSHPGAMAATFSLYDFEGFTEFVPHVRWRLKERPYAAVVVAATTFDALAWIDPRTTAPSAVDAVTTDDRILFPTRRSVARWREMRGQ
jgi:hypothetical protein